MPQQPLKPDDPRLTAYVLGELSDAERADVEAKLTTCAQSRRVVDELRDTTARLFEALQAEPAPALSEAHRDSIRAAAMNFVPPQRRSDATSPLPMAPRSESFHRRVAALAVVAVASVSVAAVLFRVGPSQAIRPLQDVSRSLAERDHDLLALNGAVTLDFKDPAQRHLHLFAVDELSRPEVAQKSERELRRRHTSHEMEQLSEPAGQDIVRNRVDSYFLEQAAAEPSDSAGTPITTTQPNYSYVPIAPFGVVDPQNGQLGGLPTSSRTMGGAPLGRQQRDSGRAGWATSAPQAGYTINTHGNPGASTSLSTGVRENGNGALSSEQLSGRAGRRLSISQIGRGSTLGDRFGGFRPRFNIVGRDQWGDGTIAGMVDPKRFSADLDVPFRQGSFELGIPENETLSTLSVTELERLRRKETRLHESLRQAESVGTESYAPIVENPFLSPVDVPLSTFGLDVDTASYANVRRFLVDEQRWPPPDAVRIEELVNYFSYADPQPEGEHPLAVTLEAAACPWDTSHRLVRIGVKGREIDLADRPPTSLVFLIDTSGSMRDENKLPLVKESLRLLVDEMTENDRIALVTYSTNAGLLLDSTSGEHADEITAVIDSLEANGSTNGEAGLKLAYDVASKHFIDSGSNRVILCTDGDFNVGESADAPLVRMISEKRGTGVFLSICGFGTGNLKDAKLEQIADHGNGQYHYVDGVKQARKVFLDELSGMLYTIAKDVKLQVEFNPAQVGAYRLLGYENRALAAEDFNNDRIDAGDLGAGHSVTALYEVVPPGAVRAKPASETPGVDPLKYQESGVSDQESGESSLAATQRGARAASDSPTPSPELLTVKLRYKQPDSDESVKLQFPLVDDAGDASPSSDLEWAAAVCSFGMILRNSSYRGQSSIEGVLELTRGAKGDDPTGERQEFIELVLEARALLRKATESLTPRPPQLSSLEAREKAAVGGRYRDLLDKFDRPDDFDRYGDFYDAGRKNASPDGGHPAGYWVYVYPHWYVWGETSRVSQSPPASDR